MFQRFSYAARSAIYAWQVFPYVNTSRQQAHQLAARTQERLPEVAPPDPENEKRWDEALSHLGADRTFAEHCIACAGSLSDATFQVLVDDLEGKPFMTQATVMTAVMQEQSELARHPSAQIWARAYSSEMSAAVGTIPRNPER